MIDGSIPLRRVERALFLDVDGTLLEIADAPQAVLVSERLKQLLVRTADAEDGALALVSGRRIIDLDHLFRPHRFPAAGLHGLERRDAAGRYVQPIAPALADLPEFGRARTAIARFTDRHPGLVFEDKGLTLALHYRRAPAQESAVQELMAGLQAELGPAFHLQPGKCVVELKPLAGTKRSAIEAFMVEPPFHGRYPVFVGDDTTDEGGFAVVNEMGGDSIRVGGQAATAARWRLGGVPDVLAWLEESLTARETAA